MAAKKAASPTMTTSLYAPETPTETVILAFNDVYEVAPLGAMGGLARVKTIKAKQKQEYGSILTVLAGDFYSPSIISTAPCMEESQCKDRVAGQQMVDVLNAVGLDAVTYGNHEFDVSYEEFLIRVNKSQFPYIASNVRGLNGAEFPNTYPYKIFKRSSIDIGMIGVVIDRNTGGFAKIDDIQTSIKTVITILNTWKEDKTPLDVIVLLTHQSLKEDVLLAKAITPHVPNQLIIGGHEHENYNVACGLNCFITKADANVKTVYVHHIEKKEHVIKITPKQLPVTNQYAEHLEVRRRAELWWQYAQKAYAGKGLDQEQPLGYISPPFDMHERVIRREHSPFGQFFTKCQHTATEKKLHTNASLTMMNSGSVRYDDELSGEIQTSALIQALPYGGSTVLISVDGEVLESAQLYSLSLPGSGAWPQLDADRVRCEEKQCEVFDIESLAWRPFHSKEIVIINDYLAAAGDSLFPKGSFVILGTGVDLHKTLASCIRRSYPQKPA